MGRAGGEGDEKGRRDDYARRVGGGEEWEVGKGDGERGRGKGKETKHYAAVYTANDSS